MNISVIINIDEDAIQKNNNKNIKLLNKDLVDVFYKAY